jgi:membrane protease YdiL (CAAX protease family)
LPLQIAVALTGVALGYLEYKILKPQPLVETFSLQAIWLPALILLVFTGFLEELIFRGLMQRASLPTIGRLGLVYVSLLFGVLHIGYRSLADLVFVFLVGLFFSLIVERTRSIFGVTLAHGLTNITLFLIFPFLPY